MRYEINLIGWCGNRCIPGVKSLKACVNSPDFCPKDTWITAPKDCLTPKMHVNSYNIKDWSFQKYCS